MNVPAPTAIRSPSELGRTAFFSGTNPTKTTATNARASAKKKEKPRPSPAAKPTLTGTIAERNAVAGERMLIGPIAKVP
jgi:hypothetical protein